MNTRKLAVFSLLIALSAYGGGAPGDPDLVLDNGVLKVGVSLTYGGAITYLSPSGSDRNLINNHDKGRQIQQSYYAGQDRNRTAQGQNASWSPWPWNPVQAGDSFNNPSHVLEATVTGGEIYTKVQPLLWDMNNELAEAHYEMWITLDENRVHVRSKLTCFRTDDDWTVVARHQELPAVYTIGALGTLYTYEGAEPFTQAPLTVIPSNWADHVNLGEFPWTYWTASEKWAASVNEALWGVGVYYRDAELFLGGFAGLGTGGETADFETTYISPLRTIAFDNDSEFEYEYDLIVGSISDIRQFVYEQEGQPYDTGGIVLPPGAVGLGATGLAVLTASLLGTGLIAAYRRRRA